MIDPSKKHEEKEYTIFDMPLVDVIVYKMKIYRLLPWEYGGRQLFQWPTRVWMKKQKKA